MLFAFLFRIALTMLLAPIAAIFFIIKNLTTISNSKSALAKAQAEYNALTSSSRNTTNGNQSRSSQSSSSSNNNRGTTQQPSHTSNRQQTFASSPRNGISEYNNSGSHRQANSSHYNERTVYDDNEETFVSTTSGRVNARLVFNGRSIPLANGRNIVGRKAETKKATVEIPTDDLYMSRQHCVINISYGADGTTKATLSNYQNKNRTAVNGRVINGQDKILLSDGNQITLGRTTMIFKNS